MAKRDFDEYYRQHKQDADVAMKEIEECTELAKENMMSQEDVQKMVQFMSPIIEAQQFLDHIYYLLNKPTKHTKFRWYDKQHKEQKNSKYNQEHIKESNQNTIDDFKKEFTR